MKVRKDLFQVKRNSRELYDLNNDYSVVRMYDRLMLVAMSVFEWKNLPLSVDEIYLEKMLLTHGQLLFFKDDDMSVQGDGKGAYFTLPFLQHNDKLDVYGNPTVRKAYSRVHSNYFKVCDSSNSVIIKDNVLNTVFNDIIWEFANHLVEIKNVIKQNLEHQKLPYIIGATDEMKQELETFFSQKRRNKPYFIIKDKFAQNLRDALALYPTNAEFVGNLLQDYYGAVWNEYMVMVGIGTNATPKRERLVSSEVTAVNEQSEVFARSRLNSRKRACNLINDMYGLEIEVDYQFGGNADGTVHNNNTVNSKEFE